VPKEFIAVDELPKSSAGKILKKELKKRMYHG
jgi:acyl-CoA synthetase (AMP-forming)/AMP-acid ligase II